MQNERKNHQRFMRSFVCDGNLSIVHLIELFNFVMLVDEGVRRDSVVVVVVAVVFDYRMLVYNLHSTMSADDDNTSK